MLKYSRKMNDDISIEEFIKVMPLRTAVYYRTVRSAGLPVDGGTDSYGIKTDFIVRDSTEVIKSLEPDPPIALVAGLVHDVVGEGRAVCSVVVMFQLGSDPANLFEIFFNYHDSSGKAPEIFRDLATQDTIAFHCYGDGGEKLRTIVVPNKHQNFWQSVTKKIRSMKPWSMEDFDMAKTRIYDKYPTPFLLFEALRKYLLT